MTYIKNISYSQVYNRNNNTDCYSTMFYTLHFTSTQFIPQRLPNSPAKEVESKVSEHRQ